MVRTSNLRKRRGERLEDWEAERKRIRDGPNHRTVEETRNAIMASYNEDAEVSISTTKIPLICPISSRRISQAARGSCCTHFQCFDLGGFLQMQSATPNWGCPVTSCRKEISLGTIVIDDYFNGILQETDDTVKMVELLPNGAWQPVEDERAGLATKQLLSVAPGDDDDVRILGDTTIRDGPNEKRSVTVPISVLYELHSKLSSVFQELNSLGYKRLGGVANSLVDMNTYIKGQIAQASERSRQSQAIDAVPVPSDASAKQLPTTSSVPRHFRPETAITVSPATTAAVEINPSSSTVAVRRDETSDYRAREPRDMPVGLECSEEEVQALKRKADYLIILGNEWEVKQELESLSDSELTLLVVANRDVLVNFRKPFSNWLLGHLDVARQVPIHAALVRNKEYAIAIVPSEIRKDVQFCLRPGSVDFMWVLRNLLRLLEKRGGGDERRNSEQTAAVIDRLTHVESSDLVDPSRLLLARSKLQRFKRVVQETKASVCASMDIAYAASIERIKATGKRYCIVADLRKKQYRRLQPTSGRFGRTDVGRYRRTGPTSNRRFGRMQRATKARCHGVPIPTYEPSRRKQKEILATCKLLLDVEPNVCCFGGAWSDPFKITYNRSMDIGAMAKGIDRTERFGEDDEDVIQWALNNRKEFDEFVIVGNFTYEYWWDEGDLLDSLRRYRTEMNLPNTRVILMTSPARVSDISENPQLVEAEPNDLPPVLRSSDDHHSSQSDEEAVSHSSVSDDDTSEDDGDEEAMHVPVA